MVKALCFVALAALGLGLFAVQPVLHKIEAVSAAIAATAQ